MSFNWNPPPFQYRNGQIRHYQIRVTDVTANLIISSGTTQSTSWRVSSLHPHTSYQCTVAAVTVAQGPSATIVLQTKQSGKTLCGILRVLASCIIHNAMLSLLLKYSHCKWFTHTNCKWSATVTCTHSVIHIFFFHPKHPLLLPISIVKDQVQWAPPHCLSTGAPHLPSTGMGGFDTTTSM